jgi:hypothetical protein
MPGAGIVWTNLVIGPDGFTESFNDHTVDLLVRMGLIFLAEQDETGPNSKRGVRVYRATGRESYA